MGQQKTKRESEREEFIYIGSGEGTQNTSMGGQGRLQAERPSGCGSHALPGAMGWSALKFLCYVWMSQLKPKRVFFFNLFLIER